MANLVVNQGLKCIGDRASAVASFGNPIQSMAVDDSASAFAAGNTQQSGATNFQGNSLDSVPTSPAAATPHVVTHVMTLTTAQFNTFVIKRVGLHNGAGTPPSATAPTASTTTLVAGIDGLSLTKAASFSLIISMKLSFS